MPVQFCYNSREGEIAQERGGGSRGRVRRFGSSPDHHSVADAREVDGGGGCSGAAAAHCHFGRRWRLKARRDDVRRRGGLMVRWRGWGGRVCSHARETVKGGRGGMLFVRSSWSGERWNDVNTSDKEKQGFTVHLQATDAYEENEAW